MQSYQNDKTKQSGMGLVEVLVSLLLLAVAVLGFSATQLQALKATDESLRRGDAMNAMRGLSEDIRLNPIRKLDYFENISGVWTATAGDNANANTAQGATVENYCTKVAVFKDDNPVACSASVSCTPDQQADFNAHQAMQAVCDANMMMNAIACPGVANAIRQFDAATVAAGGTLPTLCLLVSWDNTLPQPGDLNTSCISPAGAYVSGSACIVMETY